VKSHAVGISIYMLRSRRSRRRSFISVLKERIEDLEDRIEELEETVGIDDMTDDEGNVGSGNEGQRVVHGVGVGSASQCGGHPATSVVSGNVGVGSVPAGTTQTDPDTSLDGGQDAPDGNVGSGVTGQPDAEADGNVGDGNVGDGNVGDGNVGEK